MIFFAPWFLCLSAISHKKWNYVAERKKYQKHTQSLVTHVRQSCLRKLFSTLKIMLNMLLMLDTTNNYIIVRQKNLQSFMQFLIIFFWGVAGGRRGGGWIWWVYSIHGFMTSILLRKLNSFYCKTQWFQLKILYLYISKQGHSL